MLHPGKSPASSATPQHLLTTAWRLSTTALHGPKLLTLSIYIVYWNSSFLFSILFFPHSESQSEVYPQSAAGARLIWCGCRSLFTHTAPGPMANSYCLMPRARVMRFLFLRNLPLLRTVRHTGSPLTTLGQIPRSKAGKREWQQRGRWRTGKGWGSSLVMTST